MPLGSEIIECEDDAPPEPGAPLMLDAPIDRLNQALPKIARRAAACDQAGAFPRQDVRLLAEIGLLRAFATPARGGLPFADRQDYVDRLLEALRLIGGASLSLGRIFEGHVNAIALIERYGAPAMLERLRRDLAAGALLGVWNTEPAPGLTLEIRNGSWALSGSKSYATGLGYLDGVIATAKLPDGGKQMLLIEVGRYPGRGDERPWSVSGMRATVSGHYDFSGLPVGVESFVGAPGDYEREPMFTSGAWRFAAVQSGAVTALIAALRAHLNATGGAKDAIHRARFGRGVVAARTAWLWVREAAKRAELSANADSAPFVLMTRGVVEEAGLTVIEAVQRSVGTRAFFAGAPIDRIVRDLQLYLRQPAPDQALDRAAAAWLETDRWGADPWW